MIKENIFIHYCALIVTFKSFQIAFCHYFFEMQIGLKFFFYNEGFMYVVDRYSDNFFTFNYNHNSRI
jgi:hypothetical protein